MQELPSTFDLLIVPRVNSWTSKVIAILHVMRLKVLICSMFLRNDGITLKTRRSCLDYMKLLYI